MKKSIFLAAILIAALGFTGCNGLSRNGGDLKIDAKVSHGDLLNTQVDEVWAVGYIDLGGGNQEDIIIATAPFKNGGFKMTLTETFDERLLKPINFEYWFYYTVPANLTVSNKNVNGTCVGIFYALKNNLHFGWFRFIYTTPDTQGQAFFMFVDDDCKVYGSNNGTYTEYGQTYKYEETVDLNLKKGWNTVYDIDMHVGTTRVLKRTTKKPDFDLTWYFTGGGGLMTPPKDAKPFNFF